MKIVVAAIDNTPAARAVLSAAGALARILGAGVEAVHVREGSTAGAEAAASAGGVKLEVLNGETAPTLVTAAGLAPAVAIVLGMRSSPAGRRPAGHVALEVVSAADTPVLAVPPDCPCPVRLRVALLPLEGTRETSRAVAGLIAAALGRRRVEPVGLHVQDSEHVPRFEDQAHHEVDAWLREFERRYCQWPATGRILLRTGVPSDVVLDVAEEIHADLIVLGWSRDLSRGRAAVVRAALERSPVPVLLLPVGPVPSSTRQVLAAGRAASRSHVAGVTPDSRRRYFSTFSVGVLGSSSRNST